MISPRKTIKLGGLNVNLSKSGVGISAGGKRGRIGVNAKGKSYVSGGIGGARYRKQLSKNSGCTGILIILIVVVSMTILACI